jgi:hypothetical protein
MILKKILGFLEEIGIDYLFEDLPMSTILPGVSLKNGILIIDKNRLLYVGDVLHEAGHLACMPPDIRETMSATLVDNDISHGGEMMAMAWSFAVAKYLNIPAEVVFHENGYKGDATNLIEMFETGNGLGIPLLQWNNMCYDRDNAEKHNQTPFPHMLKWTCEENKYVL